MNKFFQKLIILNIILAILSCKDDDECLNTQLESFQIENLYNCDDTFHNLFADLALDDFKIIRNQVEFDNLVTISNCDFQIDFSTYDLIIGRTHHSSIYQMKYLFYYNCEFEKHKLAIEKKIDWNYPLEEVTFHTLIPKIPSNETIIVEIYQTSN